MISWLEWCSTVQLLQRPSSSEVLLLLQPCRSCTSCYKGDLRLPTLSIQLISYEEQFRACSRMSRSQIINIVGVVFAATLLFVYIPSLTLAQPGALLDVVWVVAEYSTHTCRNGFKVHIGVFMKLGHMRSHIYLLIDDLKLDIVVVSGIWCCNSMFHRALAERLLSVFVVRYLGAYCIIHGCLQQNISSCTRSSWMIRSWEIFLTLLLRIDYNL